MGQLILCKSPRAKAPFYIESGKVNIYSLEELMYFVQSVRFVARDDFMKPEFIDWVEKEIGMKELAEMLREKLLASSGLKDFFLPIEAANGYLTTSELQILNVQLQKYDHMSGLEAKKFYADQLMHQEKYVQAIIAYRRLLQDPSVISEQGHVAGDIWSNLGCAYAKMQDFAEAVECFARGFMLNHRIETLQEAVDAAYLSGEQKLLDGLVMRFRTNAAQIAAERAHMEQLLQQTIAGAGERSFHEQQLSQWLQTYSDQCED
ncbi:MAG: tetratricopeptide repeat protein [Lachnospiraceae bacterium]